MKKPFSWSYSRLTSFENCPRQFYEVNIAKSVAEHKGPAADPGQIVHKALENNVKRGQPLPPDLHHLKPVMDMLHKAPGESYAEQQLAITKDFKPCGWKDWDTAWCRCIVDFQKIHGTSALAVDYKTGKPREDSDQLKLVAGMVFLHEPKLERVTTMFLWLNHPKARPTVDTYWRAAVPIIWRDFMPRVNRMEAAFVNNNWPERPNGLCKQHCPVTGCKHNGRRNNVDPSKL